MCFVKTSEKLNAKKKKSILTFNFYEHIDVRYCVVVDCTFAEVVSLVGVASVVNDQSVSALARVGAQCTVVLNRTKRLH